MTSHIDPYTHSGLLALKTIGLEGMNPTYNLGQKDADTLKNVISQAFILNVLSTDNIKFPEYESFKKTILSLTDKIYGNNSIGPLFKTLLDAINVNSDGNLVLSTTNSKQLQKIDKLVADFEYQFESTYGAALFKTLGLDLSQKTNVAMESTVSKFSKAELGYKPKGVPKGVPIASPAAGGAQVGGAKLANLTPNEKRLLYETLDQLIRLTVFGQRVGYLQNLAGKLIEMNLEYNDSYRDLLPMLHFAEGMFNLTNLPAMNSEEQDRFTRIVKDMGAATAAARKEASASNPTNNGRARGLGASASRELVPRQPVASAYDDEKVDLYAAYRQIGSDVIEVRQIEIFRKKFMEDLQTILLAGLQRTGRINVDDERINVARFLLNLAVLRANDPSNQLLHDEARQYIEQIKINLEGGFPNFKQILAGTATAGIGLYMSSGIIMTQMGAASAMAPPGLLAGIPAGASAWNITAHILHNLSYHNIINLVIHSVGGSGIEEMGVGASRVIAGVCMAFLLYLCLLFYKFIMNTLELSYKEGDKEFRTMADKITKIMVYGVQATTRFGVITAAAAASMALGLPAPVAISAAASALAGNGSAASGVGSLMKPTIAAAAERRAAERRALINGHASPAAAASSSSSVAPRQYQPGSSSPSIRSLLSDHALGMAAASLAPSAAANLSSRSGASASSSSSGSGDGLTPAERAKYEAERQEFQEFEAERRAFEAERQKFEESKKRQGGVRRKRTIRKIKHKKRYTKRHTRK